MDPFNTHLRKLQEAWRLMESDIDVDIEIGPETFTYKGKKYAEVLFYRKGANLDYYNFGDMTGSGFFKTIKYVSDKIHEYLSLHKDINGIYFEPYNEKRASSFCKYLKRMGYHCVNFQSGAMSDSDEGFVIAQLNESKIPMNSKTLCQQLNELNRHTGTFREGGIDILVDQGKVWIPENSDEFDFSDFSDYAEKYGWRDDDELYERKSIIPPEELEEPEDGSAESEGRLVLNPQMWYWYELYKEQIEKSGREATTPEGWVYIIENYGDDIHVVRNDISAIMGSLINGVFIPRHFMLGTQVSGLSLIEETNKNKSVLWQVTPDIAKMIKRKGATIVTKNDVMGDGDGTPFFMAANFHGDTIKKILLYSDEKALNGAKILYKMGKISNGPF